MKTYLEYEDEKFQKFWEIEVNGNMHIVRYGKIGTDGRSATKEFDTEEKALKDAQKLIKAKTKKGYTGMGAETSEKLLNETQKEKKKEDINIDLERFENKLKYCGFGYPKWAGCRLIEDETAKVKNRVVDPEQDCIMYDERCNEGTYGISHEESGIIYEIKITNTKKFLNSTNKCNF